MIWLYGISLGLVAFSLAGYGLLWIALAALFGRKPAWPRVGTQATMLIAARNEGGDIAAKLRSVLAQDTGPHRVEVLVVSDGSEDDTGDAVRAVDDPRVRLLELPSHQGKAAALNAGLASIKDDQVVIFSDANSLLRPGALLALLAPFGAEQTGGSIGQLEISAKGGMLGRADRLFWRYDNALKRAEDRLGGAVSAQGTLYAVRRRLIGTVPATMADDLVISLGVVSRDYRLAYAEGAVATEPVTTRTGAELARRVRSTERGWRGLMAHRGLMNPARTGIYGVQLFCHKGLRRMVAFLLPLLLVSNLLVVLAADAPSQGMGVLPLATLVAQLGVYGLGVGAWLWPALARVPGASVAVLFTLGHGAMALGILRAMSGRQSAKWTPVREAPAHPSSGKTGPVQPTPGTAIPSPATHAAKD